jgi:ABC-2 type transport system permease protein
MIPDNVNIQTYISQHSITAALVIPANFTSSYLQGKQVNLIYYNNPAVSTSSVAQQAISVTVQLFNSHFAQKNQTIALVSASVTTHAANYIDFLIPGLIGLVILTSPMFSMTYIVSSYKKDKIFRQLSLTPLTKSEWFLSKFIWYLIISALSAIMIITVGVLLFHSSLSLSLYMIPFLVVGVFMFTSLGVLAGSISRSEESASVIGNIITFPMMFLSGTFFPIAIMPGWLQSVAHVLPLYYIIDGLNSVTIYSNYRSALLDLVVSIAVAAVIFALTVLKFSWKEQ